MTIEITPHQKKLIVSALREEVRVLSEIRDRLIAFGVSGSETAKSIQEHLDLLHLISTQR